MRLIGWLGLAAGFAVAAMVLFFFSVRRRIMRRVAESAGERGPVLATGARVAANGEDGGRHHPEVPGMLMLLASGLYFHSWIGGREVFVPGPSISWIGVTETAGQRPDRHRIVVRFLNAEGKEDGIAIRLLYPEQWVSAIKTNLITRVS
ncbi:MAG TPA: hypothetical protein VHE79_10475 [Spirochaetia bacterium]